MEMSSDLPPPEVTAIDPNSDAAFGERMQYRLNALLANPYPFLPPYNTRYQTLLQYSSSLTPQQAYAMSMLLGGDCTHYYPEMPNTAELQFPKVNAWQPTAQTGWYYYAGHCTGKDGKTYGVLFMTFGNALLPPLIAAACGLDDTQNQLIDMQLGITVEGGRFYQADPVVTAGTSGEVSFSDALALHAGPCSVSSTQPGKLFPLNIKAKGVDRSGAVPTELEIDFTFTSGKGYLPQGLDGACPLVAGVGTRYYSIPGLVLDAATSTLKIGGETIALESGIFWMDHQWGLGMLPAGSPAYPVMQAAANVSAAPPPGWDFFAINLDNGAALTLSSLHTTAACAAFINQTGPNSPGTMTVQVAGKYMDVFNTVFDVSGTLAISDWRKTDSTPNPAKYHNTPTWVPHGGSFTLLEGVVPEKYRSFTLEHICESAQCLWYGAGLRYVEAAVIVRGKDNEKLGAGYQEAVGYPNPLTSILSLAGMPATPEILALFGPHPLPESLVLASLLYFVGNTAEFDALMAAGSMPLKPRTAGNTPPPIPKFQTATAPVDLGNLLPNGAPGHIWAI
jgi:predicted secreted hydrolase